MNLKDTGCTSLIERTLHQIAPIDANIWRLAEARQLQLTKPTRSLGRLEEIANRCAAILGTLSLDVSKPRIVIFAGDHGVCAEGVSAYPQVVTSQMVLNFLQGGAAINCLARSSGVELKVVDVGVIGPISQCDGLICRNIAKGTNNFCFGPAMTQEQAMAALSVGMTMAEEAVADGCNLLGFGEMGIGNSTAAAAITSALVGCKPRSAVGRGTGIDDECLERKISAIERALALHRGHLSGPYETLARLGGFEIGAMCGFCLGAAANRKPVLADGFIATAAAALAVRIKPAVKDYLFAAHLSAEPGHKYLLELIGLDPLLDLNLRLGEGTGAALAVKIVQGAALAFTGMATFDSAGVATALGSSISA